MKTSNVCRGGGILFPLLLTLMVCQVQGDCVDSRVEQCIRTQGAEMRKVGQDFLRSCPIFYEMLRCVDSCSAEKKEIFNALFAHAKRTMDYHCGSGIVPTPPPIDCDVSIVQQCQRTQLAIINSTRNLRRRCAAFYESLRCMDSCSEELKAQVNAVFASLNLKRIMDRKCGRYRSYGP